MLKDMTEGTPWKIILQFTIPMLIGNIFQQLYNVVDSLIVGRYVGAGALAAVSTSYPIIFLLISMILGLTMGSSIIISQFFGAGEIDKMRHAVTTTVIFQMGAAVIMSIIGVLLAEPFLRLLQVPEDIFGEALTYARIFFSGIVFLFGYNSLSGILRSLGDSTTPLIFVAVAAVLNIGLDYHYVANLGWGVAGAAWATVISQALSMVLCYGYIVWRIPMLKFTSRKDIVFDKDILMAALKLGIPSSIQQTVVSLGMMALQGLVNSFGTATMAAYATGSSIESFCAMPIMNFGGALSTFSGQNVGAWKLDRVKRGTRDTLVMSLCVCIITSLLVFFGGPLLIELFLDAELDSTAEVVALGVEYLQTMAMFYFIFVFMSTFSGVLRGAGDTLYPMVASITSLAVRVATAYILSPMIGHMAIWISFPVGWAVGAIIPVVRFYSGAWQQKARERYEHMLSLAGREVAAED